MSRQFDFINFINVTGRFASRLAWWLLWVRSTTRSTSSCTRLQLPSLQAAQWSSNQPWKHHSGKNHGFAPCCFFLPFFPPHVKEQQKNDHISCSAVRFAEIAVSSGLPADWCMCVTAVDAVSETLVTSPALSFFSFIGSAQVGWKLQRLVVTDFFSSSISCSFFSPSSFFLSFFFYFFLQCFTYFYPLRVLALPRPTAFVVRWSTEARHQWLWTSRQTSRTQCRSSPREASTMRARCVPSSLLFPSPTFSFFFFFFFLVGFWWLFSLDTRCTFSVWRCVCSLFLYVLIFCSSLLSFSFLG